MKQLTAAVLLALGFSSVGCGGDAKPARANVILITLDTVRADFVSCYGVHQGVTPNLDALAAEGTRFDMAISTAGVTPVSHASILTGLNNHTHKLRVLAAPSGYTLPENVPTLATVLAREGYHTVAVHSAFPVSRSFGFKRGFEVFEDLDTQMHEVKQQKDDKEIVRAIWDVQNFQRRSDTTTDLVEKSLRGAEPFFLWIHYWDPHDWVMKPPEERLQPREKFFDADGKEIRPGIELYKAELNYQDEQIGRLFKGLRERGLLENTIVVITADHGQGLMEHNWAAHRLLYQEQVHVPLIVKLPGVKQAPSVKDLVRTIDVFPTVLDYAGVKAPNEVDGRSLRPLIEGKPDAKRIAFGDQINGYDTNAGMAYKEGREHDQFLYMAFDWPWKLTYRPMHPDKSELYNVEADPDEAHNLYSVQNEHAVRLRRELAKAHPWVPGPFAGKEDEDPEKAKALALLGYTPGQTVDDATWGWVCPEDTVTDLGAMTSRCPKCKSPPLMIAK
ncbi:MAG: sulfatase [Planctomycetes bacterium]|nr:sulfatase [Planctomycetota bacterium]